MFFLGILEDAHEAKILQLDVVLGKETWERQPLQPSLAEPLTELLLFASPNLPAALKDAAADIDAVVAAADADAAEKADAVAAAVEADATAAPPKSLATVTVPPTTAAENPSAIAAGVFPAAAVTCPITAAVAFGGRQQEHWQALQGASPTASAGVSSAAVSTAAAEAEVHMPVAPVSIGPKGLILDGEEFVVAPSAVVTLAVSWCCL